MLTIIFLNTYTRNPNINFTFFQVDEKKRKIAANSNSKGGKSAKRPKIDNDVIII